MVPAIQVPSSAKSPLPGGQLYAMAPSYLASARRIAIYFKDNRLAAFHLHSLTSQLITPPCLSAIHRPASLRMRPPTVPPRPLPLHLPPLARSPFCAPLRAAIPIPFPGCDSIKTEMSPSSACPAVALPQGPTRLNDPGPRSVHTDGSTQPTRSTSLGRHIPALFLPRRSPSLGWPSKARPTAGL
jgi:hypothetical protein